MTVFVVPIVLLFVVLPLIVVAVLVAAAVQPVPHRIMRRRRTDL